MTADTIGGMPRRQRPFGVSLLAVVSAIGCLAGVVALWAVLGGAAAVDGAILIALVVTVAGGFAAYGLWNLRPWAWPLAIATWAVGTLEALWLLTNGVINSNLVVGPLVLLYLRRPDIRSLFQEQR